MQIGKNQLGVTLVALFAFVLGAIAGGTRGSLASQGEPRERFEYRVLKEPSVGGRLGDTRTREHTGPSAPPNGLEELLNKYGKDGWEVEELRLRLAQSTLKGSRRGPAYYLYSNAGDTGPRFLRLRRRVD